MVRPFVGLLCLGLSVALLSPVQPASADDPLASAPGALQKPDPRPYGAPAPVQPDYAYAGPSGTRVEVYSSVGDNDANSSVEFSDQDWRPINAYAYLVSSVPKEKQLYTTVYNALNDYKTSKLGSDGRWGLSDGSTESIFSPTQAFMTVVNQYAGEVEGGQPRAKKFVHVLGNKTSMNDAVKAPSSLATLVTKATDYKICSSGSGACLTTRPSGENFMHAKYAAFEQARDSTGTLRNNVVWITSANLNGASGGKKSNVSIAIYNDKPAYDALVKLYGYETSSNKTEAKKQYFANLAPGESGIATASGVKLFPSPRTSSSDLGAVDFEAKLLRDSSVASLAKSAPGQARTDCRVYAVHSLFSRDDIVSALGELQRDKCDVKVVLGTNAIADVASYYFATSAELRTLVEKVQFGNVHDKTLSVSYLRGGTPVNATFGGSANFNGTSLQYDEVAFRSDSADVAKVVQRHSERLYQLAQGSDRAVGATGVSFRGADPATIVAGETLKLKPVVAPSNASVKTVTWSSDDPNVATVSSDGTVTARPVLVPTRTTIRALTVSGAHQAAKVVDVVPAGAGETSPSDGTPDPTTVVSSPPELSMKPTQSPGEQTPMVVTWSQGNQPLDGVVQLQYWSKGTWKAYRDVTVKSGRWAGSFAFKASHTWRAQGTKVNGGGATLPKSVVRGFVPNVVRTRGANDVLRSYAPDLVVSGTKVIYTVSWNNPYAGRKGLNNNVRLQYYTGKKWVTAETFAMPKGKVNMNVSYPAVKSRKWRFASGVSSQPSGVKAKTSSPILVTTTSAS